MTIKKLLTSAALTALMVSGSAWAEESTSSDSGETRIEPYFGRFSPFYGRFSPFEGDVSPFWGRLSPFEGGEAEPFWGRLSPFEGDIESFWGRFSPFEDNQALEPFWGRLSPFWGRLSPFWGRLSPFDEENNGDPALAMQHLQSLLEESELFWGDRIQTATGEDFWEGFANDILEEFGIDLNDPSSLENFTNVERAEFMFAWYDGLMSFSGVDHVDHWMETANWSPALTQVQGMGTDTIIGLLDFSLTKDQDLNDNLLVWSGNQDASGGHGGAVASLLVADHDGEGLMGIAPNASVALYNPFDEDGTANWESITQGIIDVGSARASVVNLSLGVPGSVFDPEWVEVYGNSTVQSLVDQIVFVHAAGNDGVEQQFDINLQLQNMPELVFVGSVGPNGEISGFSNTPGDACLVAKNQNHCEVYLRDRFVVAPGEWILVTDGEGGVTRRSGTSFAAPLVTGAIALLHDRWGWLKEHPSETADIIFMTADDVGAPGVDSVYGHGILNIEASQSPINYEMLYQYGTDKKGRTTKNYLGQLGSNHVGALLNTGDGYVTVLEDVGATYRDFLIPLDDVVSGLGMTVNGDQEMLQDFLSGGLDSLGTLSNGKKVKKKKKKIVAGMEMEVQAFALPFAHQQSSQGLPYATEYSMISDQGVAVSFGNGVGAMSLTGDAAARVSRFDPRTGGANPILGLASGGGYARVEVPAFGTSRLSIGTTNRTFEDRFEDPLTGEWQIANSDRAIYEASALHASLVQPVGSDLSFTLGYTRLNENNAALGTQSTLDNAFESGAVTDALSVGADWALTNRITFTGSAMFGETHAQGDSQGLTVGDEGIQTSAFEVAVEIDQLIMQRDRARVAFLQPMHVESGALAVTGYQVADRRSGELVLQTNQFGLEHERAFAMEVAWGTPVLKDLAEVSGFVRLESDVRGRTVDRAQMAGFKFDLEF